MAVSWPPKDPAAIADYSYTIALDEGDEVSAATLTVISGSVVIDSSTVTGATITAWLSGGADGETAVFRVAWSTTGGRSFDDIVTIAVVSVFDSPAPSDLVARYPQFSAVPTGVLAYWLADSTRFVDESWPIVADRAPAMIAVAAHNMMNAGVAGIGDSDVTALLAAGVTDFQSGGREGFRLSLSPLAIQQALLGGYEATKPGQEYSQLLARNKGGARVTAPGAIPCANFGYNGFAGPLGYPAALWPC